ncbi:MAG: hypothetical protein HOQ32_08845 [Lysobacter sp.]|nr:hypothetical protein [Lysobacter sp.]
MANKQLNLTHIMIAEWLEETISVNHPKRGHIPMYGIKITLSTGHQEQMLYDVEQDRHDAWQKLLAAMEAAGY